MTIQPRENGKFVPKSDSPREVRTIRATEEIWTKFGDLADSVDISRADLLEELVSRLRVSFTPEDLELEQELRVVPREAEVTANTVFDIPDTSLDNYNFSDLNPRSRKVLATIFSGFYAGAAHFAKNNNIPLQIAELEFARSCMAILQVVSDEEIAETVRAIDSNHLMPFSDVMSEKIWDWGKRQEAVAASLEDFEDFDDEIMLSEGIEDEYV